MHRCDTVSGRLGSFISFDCFAYSFDYFLTDSVVLILL